MTMYAFYAQFFKTRLGSEGQTDPTQHMMEHLLTHRPELYLRLMDRYGASYDSMAFDDLVVAIERFW